MEVRNLSARYDENVAQGGVLEWIEDGLFSRKNIASDLRLHAELSHMPYVRAHVRSSMEWNAQGGTHNARDFDRDLNNYHDQYRRWESSGHRGPGPRHPDRSAYMEWRADAGTRSDETVFQQLALPASAFLDNKVLAACENLGPSVWNYWQAAQQDGSFNVNDIPWTDLKKNWHNEAIKISASLAQNEAGKRWTSLRDFRYNAETDLFNFDILLYPIFIFHYEFESRNYTVACDAYTGSAIGGTRPTDKAKIGKFAGVFALMIVAIVGLGLIVRHFGHSNNSEKIAYNVPFMSGRETASIEQPTVVKEITKNSVDEPALISTENNQNIPVAVQGTQNNAKSPDLSDFTLNTIPQQFYGEWDEIVSDGCKGREARATISATTISSFEIIADVEGVKMLGPNKVEVAITGQGDEGQYHQKQVLEIVDDGQRLSVDGDRLRKCPSS